MAAITVLSVVTLCNFSSSALAQANGESVLARYTLAEDSSRHWELPARLDEISGLALTGDERLLAVADEQAIVYELDYEEGRLVKAFALGDPTLRGDFEGIAWLDERIYLVTSKGVVYAAAEGADGERVPFREHRTALGRNCEIEGLAADPDSRALLLLCKRSVAGSDRDKPMIFFWSTTDGAVERARRIELPRQAIEAALGSGGLHPSGIARAGAAGHWLIVAAREKAIIEITADGELVGARILPLAARHAQPEGIEWLPDGRLLIADEGSGGRGRLAVYRPRTGPSGDEQ